jgi:hypothetical protein
MIEVTLAEAVRRGWQRVGLLVFHTPLVYAQALEQRGLAWESIDAALQKPLNAAIQAVTEGRDDTQSVEQARRALMERGSDGRIYLTQWFERARFEYHSGNPAPYQVLLGRLGAELLGK